MRSGLAKAAARGLLQANLGPLPTVTPAPTGAPAASLAAAGTTLLQACWFRASPVPTLGVGAAGVTAAGAAMAGGGASEERQDELGDLLPGMSLEEEEDDEAQHYV